MTATNVHGMELQQPSLLSTIDGEIAGGTNSFLSGSTINPISTVATAENSQSHLFADHGLITGTNEQPNYGGYMANGDSDDEEDCELENTPISERVRSYVEKSARSG